MISFGGDGGGDAGVAGRSSKSRKFVKLVKDLREKMHENSSEIENEAKKLQIYQ